MNPDNKKDKNPVATEAVDTLVILSDCQLLELPLEALDMFENQNILSMTRDVSLQMLYHRFHQEQLTRKYWQWHLLKLMYNALLSSIVTA